MIIYRKHGFTLIELLVVVAIIAIIATIALVNYQTAQSRANVSRVKGELATIALALEGYLVDFNDYPLMRGNIVDGPQLNRPEDQTGFGFNCVQSFRTLPVELTTPIAYISSLIKDPFKSSGYDYNLHRSFKSGNPLDQGYTYTNIPEFMLSPTSGYDESDYMAYGAWRLASLGPDKEAVNTFGRTVYDPTNGNSSNGEILRTQISSEGQRTSPTHGID